MSAEIRIKVLVAFQYSTALSIVIAASAPPGGLPAHLISSPKCQNAVARESEIIPA